MGSGSNGVFTGRAGRLAHLRIFLEGREEATYQRGTDTITEREVFSTVRPGQHSRTTGRYLEDRPSSRSRADSLCTALKPASNKIIWEIKVEGEIDRWPDIGQNFPNARSDQYAKENL